MCITLQIRLIRVVYYYKSLIIKYLSGKNNQNQHMIID